MNLVAYLRVSTEKQAREGISLEAQEARIRAYAAAMGHEVVEVCRDDGASGSIAPGGRRGLTRALWRVEAGPTESREGASGGARGLVVSSLSRLSRSVRDILALVDRARDSGWHLLSLSESLDTSTATGRMVVGILAVLSQFERELTSERTAEAIAKLRANGAAFTSQPPYGFRFVGGRAVEEPRERAVLDYVRARSQAGWMPGLIAERLNAEEHFDRQGRPWTGESVRRVLRAIRRASAPEEEK